jgi:hypothetical protein
VTGSDLDVAERYTRVESSHDEPGSEHVRMHRAQPRTLADGADPPMGRAAIEALTVSAAEDRTFAAFADGDVDGLAVRGTIGTMAGLLPLPTMRRVLCPRFIPRPGPVRAPPARR